MIFGFNTDVKHEDLVYHVQSETQQGDSLLQTQVFVGGRCLGKCELLLTNVLALQGHADRDVHGLLKSQHRQVIESIRAGEADTLFQPADLKLQWLEASAKADEEGLTVSFLLANADRPLAGACFLARIDCAGLDPVFAEAESEADGTAHLHFSVRRDSLADSTLLVDVTHAGRSLSNKFRLHARRQACCSDSSLNDLFT